MSTEGHTPLSVLVVGGSSGLGLELARAYAERGDAVTVTSRDAGRAATAAAAVGASATGLALDLAAPETIASCLADLGPVDRVVLAAIERDSNSVREYDVARAIRLVTLKLVGYTEVVHTLVDRLTPEASILLFGGLAKERPYPGSTTVTTINGGVSTLIRTLALELAPLRVNAIHPTIVGDSPEWASKPDVLDAVAKRTPIGRCVTMAEVVDASLFLLENGAINGQNLTVDGGWMMN